MEEINLTAKELKDIIDNNKLLGTGNYGAVIEYGNQLLKIDIDLYKKLKGKNFYNIDYNICEHYKYYYDKDFQDRNQIEDLVRRQKDVKLTQLPRGIVTLKSDSKDINGISPGIIIYYHKNYKKLESLDPRDCKKVLIILKKILREIEELEENKISQTDLIHYEDYEIEKRNTNILYKGDNPEIIDTSGFFVRSGDKFISACDMYRDFSNIILDYFYFNHLKAPVIREKVTTYNEDYDLIKEFEERTRKL